MSFFNRLTAVIMIAILIGPLTPLEARTKRGDKFFAEGRAHETKKEWDAALVSFQQPLTPSEEARRKNNERLSSILPVPELKPINPDPTRLKMNGSPKTLFETIVKVFGGPSFNVIWDPDYQPQVKGNVTVDFESATL